MRTYFEDFKTSGKHLTYFATIKIVCANIKCSLKFSHAL